MSARLAALHASAFAQPWSAAEIDALMAGGALPIEAPGGFILIRLAADEAEILTLAVRPDARHSGVGRGLVERACETAASNGAARLFLEVAADNAPALALYRAAGFSQVAVRPNYYRRPDSRMQDALIFERPLNSP